METSSTLWVRIEITVPWGWFCLGNLTFLLASCLSEPRRLSSLKFLIRIDFRLTSFLTTYVRRTKYMKKIRISVNVRNCSLRFIKKVEIFELLTDFDVTIVIKSPRLQGNPQFEYGSVKDKNKTLMNFAFVSSMKN